MSHGPLTFTQGLAAHWRVKLAVTATILAYWALGYFSLNQVHYADAADIPATPIDSLPLIPWTVVIYHSIFVLNGLGIWMHRTRRDLQVYLVAVIVAYTINFTFFAVLPTEIVRPPLPESDSMWLWAIELTWKLDAPRTAFPSLHITNCALAVGPYVRTRLGKLLVVWAFAIAISTLTTKQHLFWDLPSGALVGIAGLWLAPRLLGRFGSGTDVAGGDRPAE